jgi:hypothetical protein
VTVLEKRDIEVCVRCLTVLREGDEVVFFEEFDSQWAHCPVRDTEGCFDRQRKNRKHHHREIGRRVSYLKKGEHLVVVQDTFGAVWGYGNEYHKTEVGEDPQEKWESLKANDKEGALVLDLIAGRA